MDGLRYWIIYAFKIQEQMSTFRVPIIERVTERVSSLLLDLHSSTLAGQLTPESIIGGKINYIKSANIWGDNI